MPHPGLFAGQWERVPQPSRRPARALRLCGLLALHLPAPGGPVPSPWRPGILSLQPPAALALPAPLPLTAPGPAAEERGPAW